VGAPGDERVQADELFRDPMAIALPADHPLVHGPGPELVDLRYESWITPHECPCRQAIFQACRSVGFTPEVVSETSDYMAMQGLVASGVGVALMPRLVAAISVHPGIVMRPLAGASLTRVVTLAARPTGYRPPACEPMLAALHDATESLRRYLNEVISSPFELVSEREHGGHAAV
jgi:DNA-binding transcriptional LysR family regulator